MERLLSAWVSMNVRFCYGYMKIIYNYYSIITSVQHIYRFEFDLYIFKVKLTQESYKPPKKLNSIARGASSVVVVAATDEFYTTRTQDNPYPREPVPRSETTHTHSAVFYVVSLHVVSLHVGLVYYCRGILKHFALFL